MQEVTRTSADGGLHSDQEADRSLLQQRDRDEGRPLYPPASLSAQDEVRNDESSSD